MKKLFRFATLCLAVGILATAAVQAGQIRIGYSCSNFNDIFQIYVVDAARAAAAEHPEVVLDVMDAQEDVIRQQDQVMTMIQSGIDVLVVVPVDTSAVSGIETLAKNANLPLIYVNRNPYPNENAPENVYFIGANSILEGETQMEYIGEKMGGKGNIVILMGILSNEASINRTQGVHNVITAKYPDIKVLAEETGNWQQDQGMTVMENWITAYGDQINAVVSNNDNMVLGAINALEAAGMKDVYTIGIDATTDALQAILADRMTATVLQDPVAQGRGAVEAAVKLMNGESLPAITKLPAELITKENAQAQLDKSK
ncbi:MAG: substrate-binding domain-containing protein [Planctomycetaceae bacterium]|nr:substrate-binding domain-containing protein [Planctomycetaceae bacterium]